ncbi:TLD-domain-containing protein [Fimicolochytrium jonesii]|uniref:TLD-domain-containing protein n=1 Tax=Fimicolochytrium jonesii TaxID=1396493 RepID=UPI0022FE12DA|nr:TLD-domain-containing protein [Fimicolochytrium jonesii]KAI8818440.1 TLD-domain-containing protein [Fimicolochytrium jonesii]
MGASQSHGEESPPRRGSAATSPSEIPPDGIHPSRSSLVSEHPFSAPTLAAARSAYLKLRDVQPDGEKEGGIRLSRFVVVGGLQTWLSARLFKSACEDGEREILHYEGFLRILQLLVRDDACYVTPHTAEELRQADLQLLQCLSLKTGAFTRADLCELLSAVADVAITQLRALNKSADRPQLGSESLEPDSPRIKMLSGQILRANQTNGISGDVESITVEDLQKWFIRNMPFIFEPVRFAFIQTWLTLNEEAQLPLYPPQHIPVVGKSEILTDAMTWILSSFLKLPAPAAKEHTLALAESQQGETVAQWDLLFSARNDGYSINRFEYHTLKYPKPSLLLVSGSLPASKTSNGEPQLITIGAYVDCPWKKSKSFWGTPDCMLFQLDPVVDLFRTNVESSTHAKLPLDHFVYFSADSGVIGFGGEIGTFNFSTDLRTATLNLNSTSPLNVTTQAQRPPTYDFGPRGAKQESGITFDVDDLEVFGLGGTQARQRQRREWDFDARDAARRSGLVSHHRGGDATAADLEITKQILAMAGVYSGADQ